MTKLSTFIIESCPDKGVSLKSKMQSMWGSC